MKKIFLFYTLCTSLFASSLTYTACAANYSEDDSSSEDENSLTEIEKKRPLSEFLKELIEQDKALLTMMDKEIEQAFTLELQNLEKKYLIENCIKKSTLRFTEKRELIQMQIDHLRSRLSKEESDSQPSKAILEIYQKQINLLKKQLKAVVPTKEEQEEAILKKAIEKAQQERRNVPEAATPSPRARKKIAKTYVSVERARQDTVFDSDYELIAINSLVAGDLTLPEFYRIVISGFAELVKKNLIGRGEQLSNNSKYFCPVHGLLHRERFEKETVSIQAATHDCTPEQLRSLEDAPPAAAAAGERFNQMLDTLSEHTSTSHGFSPKLTLKRLTAANAQAFIDSENDPRRKVLKRSIVAALDYLDGYENEKIKRELEDMHLFEWTCKH